MPGSGEKFSVAPFFYMFDKGQFLGNFSFGDFLDWPKFAYFTTLDEDIKILSYAE